uniref:DB domain-containing protein n=1 Tax=Globodera pallida TaxID=36090 RepID=A0A183C8Q2_GLOPA
MRRLVSDIFLPPPPPLSNLCLISQPQRLGMIVTVEPKNEAGNNINTRTYSPGTDLLMEQHQMKKSARYNSYRIFALGFLATVFLLLIICANVQMAFAANRQLTPEELVDLCPDEKEFCYTTALLGNCFGKSVKVGDRDMNFCLPLCGYNTSVNELGSGLGLKCVSQLTTWAYCAGDANDNTKCCRGKGVEDECLSFCKGDVPTCDMQSIFSYQKILECQMENLDNKPRFDPEWRPECDWERKMSQNSVTKLEFPLPFQAISTLNHFSQLMSADGTIQNVAKGFGIEVVNSNFEIIQVIKAADQLFYKDKTLYTAIKPELIRSDKDRSTNVEHSQQKLKSGKRTDGQFSTADNQKQNKDKEGNNKSSKLQEVIGQAKKTVEEALGTSHGHSAECQQNSTDLCRELAKVRAENADLAKKLEAQEQRLRAVETLTKGVG